MTAEIVHIRRHGLREGDAVRSMDGGPIMLVAVSDAAIVAEVQCVWTERRRLRTATLSADRLVVVARP